jgi:hypothetical protein
MSFHRPSLGYGILEAPLNLLLDYLQLTSSVSERFEVKA